MANTRRGLGLAALAPGYSFAHADQTNIDQRLKDVLQGVSQSLGRNLRINSGYRSPSYNRAVKGAKNSLHVRGLAADISLDGMSVTEKQNLVQELTQRGIGGLITYDAPNNSIHVDMRKRGVNGPLFMHEKTARKMARAPDWFKEMAKYGGIKTPDIAPTPYGPDSVPASPDLSGAPMLRPDNVAYTGPNITGMRAAMPSPMRPDNANFAGPAGNFNVNSFGPVGAVQRGPLGPASLPPDRPMPSGPMNAPQRPSTPAGPSLSTPGQALAYGQLGGTMALAGIRNLDGTPAANVSLPPDRPMPTGPITPPSPNLVSNLPTASVVPTISPVPPTTQVAPVYTPPRTVAPMQESSFPAAPPAPTRPSISDVYAGMPGTAISNAGIEVSRAPGGFIDRYNPQFDVTTVETPQGYQAATLGKGRLSRTDQARSLLGNKQLSDKAKRGLGTVLGGLLGGAVAGPLGGMLGGVVGNRIAGGGVLGGVLGYGANYFPDAPTRPDASWGPGMSDSDLRSYAGDRVADAVKAGRAGLY